MYHLLRKQIVCGCCFLFMLLHYVKGQVVQHRTDHDDWPYYFGITLGYNSYNFHTTKHPNFLASDSVMYANPVSGGGLTLGLLSTFRLGTHLQFRANPQLILGGTKSIFYQLGSVQRGESLQQEQLLPATLVALPLHFKLNSDRIGNFRTYLLGGIRFQYDVSSNSTARNAEDMVKLKPVDWGVEAGIGFNFYLPFVTISPEIKISNGISNIHKRDPQLKFSNVIDRIQSRMIVFSIHIED